VVAPANFNSPGQIVIAGHSGAVSRAIEIAKGRGFRKAMLLPVSAPFHCSLMTPAGERLAETLEKVQINPLKIPVVTNVEALPNLDKDRVRELLIRQVSAPVLWETSVTRMLEEGIERFVEVGPGKVLTGLVKRISKNVDACNVEDTETMQAL
jgi:[acyl-carrier-protein] S-malonyltransferase